MKWLDTLAGIPLQQKINTIQEHYPSAIFSESGIMYSLLKIDGDKIIAIEEKPENPKSNYAVIGIYMYDAQVFDIINQQKPSDRGELEITDVNNAYIEKGQMTYDILDGWWTDAGTIESLFRASQLVEKTGANNVDE